MLMPSVSQVRRMITFTLDPPSIIVPGTSLPLMMTVTTGLLVSTTASPSSGFEKNVGVDSELYGYNAKLLPVYLIPQSSLLTGWWLVVPLLLRQSSSWLLAVLLWALPSIDCYNPLHFSNNCSIASGRHLVHLCLCLLVAFCGNLD